MGARGHDANERGAMRIYLAASSREVERVRALAERVEAAGLTIALNWWDLGPHGTAQEWAGKDGCLSRDLQRHITRRHMRAIKECHVFWLLFPGDGLRSTCESELAFALARQGEDCAVIVTGELAHVAPWTSVADYREVEDLLGLAELARIAVAAHRIRMGGARV